MASDFTPLELHVNAIKEALNPVATASERNRVEVKFGEIGQHEWGCPRRILFEPSDSELTEPRATGKIEVAELEWARPKRAANVGITAHIVAESHTALWVLWSNLIIACDDSLGDFSREDVFNLNPEDKSAASHLDDGARYMTQQFVWTFHLFDKMIALPPYGQDVTLLKTGALVAADAFTNTQDYLDPDEADPE